VRLLGDQAAQARAVKLLSEHCRSLVLPEDTAKLTGSIRAHMLRRFDPVLRGPNIVLTTDHMVAKRSEKCAGCFTPSDCVVAGAGVMGLYERGAYFCLGVQRAEVDRRHRAATRVGISNVPVVAPMPDGLLSQPRCSWVFGRGVARGPDGRSFPLPAANFDRLREGDELGVLVTRTKGSIAAFRKPKGEDKFHCLVHWDACVPEPHSDLHMLLELAGVIVEVELLPDRLPPDAGVGLARDPVADAAAAALGAPKPPAPAPTTLLPEALHLPVPAALDASGAAAEAPLDLLAPGAQTRAAGGAPRTSGYTPAGTHEDLVPTLMGELLVD